MKGEIGMDKIGIIHEVGDLGIGFNELKEEEAKKLKDTDKDKEKKK